MVTSGSLNLSTIEQDHSKSLSESGEDVGNYKSFFSAKKDIHFTREIQISLFVSQTLEAKEPFTDPEFPPSQQSIFLENNTDIPEADKAHYKRLKWERLSTVYPEQKIHGDTFKLDDLLQGTLGNCYFLAGLAALAD